MIVISDTSPILNLAAVGQLELLLKLYRKVAMPPEVERELRRNGFTQSLSWLVVIQPTDKLQILHLISMLDAGEAEAIALAKELNAQKLLIDERLGRRIAIENGIPVTGVLGVLADAKRAGFVDACDPRTAGQHRRFLGERGPSRAFSTVRRRGMNGLPDCGYVHGLPGETDRRGTEVRQDDSVRFTGEPRAARLAIPQARQGEG